MTTKESEFLQRVYMHPSYIDLMTILHNRMEESQIAASLDITQRIVDRLIQQPTFEDTVQSIEVLLSCPTIRVCQ